MKLPSAVPAVRSRDGSWGLVAVSFGGALLYATARYNVFKGVPWADWPAYTVNKALAFASLALIVIAVFRLGIRRSTSVVMASAGALALAHALLSFALLNPHYYAKFFEGGALTFLAGLSLTIGVAATAAMDLGARRSGSWRPGQRHAALALVAFAVGVHAALPAFTGWIAPSTWPGWMPPITLLSFLLGCVAVILWARRSRSTPMTNRTVKFD